MADMLMGSAQGAVDSLLGRLTSALTLEAQLLDGVRGDVQFIKVEMESMNGFLMHVAEATGDDGEDHQVRAWTKQVAEVAYSSQNCVDLYVQSLGPGTAAAGNNGVLGFFRRLPRLVWTLPTRHRLAKQLRELKIRAREVGERRQRYGVEAPANARRDGAKVNKKPWHGGGDDDAREQEDARRRALAEAHRPPDHHIHVLVNKLLLDQGADHAGSGLQQLKVLIILGLGGFGKTTAAQKVWEKSAIQDSFDVKIWMCVSLKAEISMLLRGILDQMLSIPQRTQLAFQHKIDSNQEQHLVEMLQMHLEGKKVLVVLDDVWMGDSLLSCVKLRSVLSNAKCSPGSALLVTSRHSEVVDSFNPCETFRMPDDLHDFYKDNAVALLNNPSDDLKHVLKVIVTKLAALDLSWILLQEKEEKDPSWIHMFLRTLYLNPCRTKEDFQGLEHNLDNGSMFNGMRLLRFIYNDLSSNCRNCLLYLSIFPEDSTLRRTSLVRRWVADGMITKMGRYSVMDEADRCFNLLVDHGFLMPISTDVAGKVKSCNMHDLIHDFVISTARDEGFLKTNVPTDLTHRLSVRQAPEQLHANTTYSKACWNICTHVNQCFQKEIDESSSTKMFLEFLHLSTHFGLLEVLDLEGCKDLKDHHLKNICSHLLQLKYLSLRNTDITSLPKQIDKLRYLEALDIRHTRVQAFAKNSIMLPKLKNLLAGHKTDCTSQAGDIQSEEPFFTVRMPRHIETMTELQVLSHVAVSGSGVELVDIASLLRLRKLGMIIQRPQKPVFRHLYYAIGKLSRSLQTLSIRIVADNENADTDMEEKLAIPPKYLQALEISGLVSGFPAWVEHLRELTKVTLHKTLLKADDIRILGKLIRLCYLRLWQDSCIERTLTFSKDEFQGLKFLVIECSDMTTINFGDKATPKLKKIVWISSGPQPQTLTGIDQLLSLKALKVQGNFDIEGLELALAANTNGPILE